MSAKEEPQSTTKSEATDHFLPLVAGCYDTHIKDTSAPPPNRTQVVNIPTNCMIEQVPPGLMAARMQIGAGSTSSVPLLQSKVLNNQAKGYSSS